MGYLVWRNHFRLLVYATAPLAPGEEVLSGPSGILGRLKHQVLL